MKPSENLTHLNYLRQQTKSDPALMIDLIDIYLEQTPTLITAMKNGLDKQDWQLLKNAAHKLIPSFRVMSIDQKYADMARKVEELAAGQQSLEIITGLVDELEITCNKVYEELREEISSLKKA